MSWYQEALVETGRAPALWLLVGFLVTFALTRFVTRRIRARRLRELSGVVSKRRILSDIHIGGVHVHHQVWGILLVLVVGLVMVRFSPQSPWLEVLAAAFGAGAALVLDQFALWVHLDDVYWTEDGRKSIDAVMLTTLVLVAMLVQVSPADASPTSTAGAWATAGALVVHFAVVIVAFLKGKRRLGVIGVVVPGVALVGAIRLAKPTSFWALRFYSAARRRRATMRFSHDYMARWDRIRDWIGGEHGISLPRKLEASITDSLESATQSPPRHDRAERR